MSTTRLFDHERERFVSACTEHGMSETDARAILRDAATVDLWAVRECNGEVEHRPEACEERGYPTYSNAGHGTAALYKRLTVPAGAWLRHHNVEGPGLSYYSLVRRPTGPWAEARITARVRAAGPGWAVRFNGDPRGSVVCVQIPGVRGNCGDGEWYAVPCRLH